MNALLQQAINRAVTMGPTVLMPPGHQVRRPVDVLDAPGLAIDDKRTILAAWASDFYAIGSKPSLRHVPGTAEPVSIDDVQAALRELDRRCDL
jgi:hypothetical protein